MRFRVAIFEDYNAPEVVKIPWAAKGITPLSVIYNGYLFLQVLSQRTCEYRGRNIVGHRYIGAAEQRNCEEMSQEENSTAKRRNICRAVDFVAASLYKTCRSRRCLFASTRVPNDNIDAAPSSRVEGWRALDPR